MKDNHECSCLASQFVKNKQILIKKNLAKHASEDIVVDYIMPKQNL